MSNKVETTGKIPQRSDIDDKYKWHLADIYATTDDWEKDYQTAGDLIEKAPGFSGKLNEAKTLFSALEMRSELNKILFNLFQYAKLSLDLDTRVSKFQEMFDRAQMLSANAAAAFSFIEPELMKMSDEQLLELSYNFEKTDIYDFYIKELIRSRSHIRSEEVEELLSLSSMVSRGPDSTFAMLDNADLKYPSIKDENGNEVQLTKQRYSQYMESTNREVRKSANAAFTSVYKDHINTIAANLSSHINGDVFYTKARRYDSCLSSALDSNNIPVGVYMSLLDTTETNLEGLHNWIALRKKILKLDEIAPYDIYCPLFPDADYKVPYEEAVAKVVECCQPLGDEYIKTLKHAFASRWVDVFETEGKAGGAYNWGNYTAHPFVLMNYNDTVDNMFTLAHELGHCLHSYLSSKNQPYQKAHYSIFVAEVASTLNEGLMLELLLKSVETKEQKLYLLNRHIDNTMSTYFHQVMYARFELLVHEQIEKGNALSHEIFSKIFGDLISKYYGPELTMDEYSPLKWARIPHFYDSFYVYQYATSYAASQAILTKFLNGEEGIIEKYLTLLSSGGSDYPINQLKACGVDMTSPAPFKATLALFKKQVEEIEQLTS